MRCKVRDALVQQARTARTIDHDETWWLGEVAIHVATHAAGGSPRELVTCLRDSETPASCFTAYVAARTTLDAKLAPYLALWTKALTLSRSCADAGEAHYGEARWRDRRRRHRTRQARARRAAPDSARV
jgi:hypothetical protein